MAEISAAASQLHPTERAHGPRRVFTIGHSRHLWQPFLAQLKRHAVDCIADVHSMPYSRRAPHFNKKELERALARTDIRYEFLGQTLGGRPKQPSYYDETGNLRYERLVHSAEFQLGIESVLKLMQCHRVGLLCGEENPYKCHRRSVVGRRLQSKGITVQHIRADGSVVTDVGDAILL